MDTIAEIYSGASSGAYHLKWYVQNMVGRDLIYLPAMRILGKNASQSQNMPKSPLKVVCVGLGRTGTYSLTLALNELGYPTLHTQHMYESPKILDMWTESVFKPAINTGELSLGDPDFDLIVSHGFAGVADLPMAFYFEEIYRLYPDCKFILTTRENSDTWFKSWEVMTTSIAHTTQLSGAFFRHVQQLQLYLRWMYGIINKDTGILMTPLHKPIPSQIRDRAISSYEEHNQRVRKIIPREQLLEYNVAEGWAPLCTFLNISHCPNTAFPKTNSALSIRVQTITAVCVTATAGILAAYTLFLICYKLLKLLLKFNSFVVRVTAGRTRSKTV